MDVHLLAVHSVERSRINQAPRKGRDGMEVIPTATAKDRSAELYRWPKYKDAYMRAFAKMLDRRKALGRETKLWETPRDVFNWWMNFNVLPNQQSLFDEPESDDDE